ncbi:adenylate/guanylate cyclase domain-containing protein [Tistrella bauzanensis]
MLHRIGAPADVRLACRIRPIGDVTVLPLIPAGDRAASVAASEPGGPSHGGLVGGAREAVVVALFVDLRASTRLAAERTAYDALYLIERYVDTVTDAIRRTGGRVTGIAGDGVMSVFGGTGATDDIPGTCAAALAAAAAIWDGVDLLSVELRHDLIAPLKIGIGIHLGPSVVGTIGMAEPRPIQFLGDTGNVAARLEAATKDHDCTVVVSDAVIAGIVAGGQGPAAGVMAAVPHRLLDIRGRDGVLPVRLVASRAMLDRLRGVI